MNRSSAPPPDEQAGNEQAGYEAEAPPPGDAPAPPSQAPSSQAPPSQTDSPRRRRPSRGCLVGLILLALLAVDQFQPPRHQVSATVLLAGIDLYQATLSKAMPDMGVRCRFEPTCSHYGEAAIRKHGAVVGSARAAWRIARCGPWTPQGTYDPP